MTEFIVPRSAFSGWHQVVLDGQKEAKIFLPEDVEHYLVMLLSRFTAMPDIVDAIVGKLYFETANQSFVMKEDNLRNVGDYCLFFAGFFPQVAIRRHVNVSYFSDLGKTVYGELAVYHSGSMHDLYHHLVLQFDYMKRVLRSIYGLSHPDAERENSLYLIINELNNIRRISS